MYMIKGTFASRAASAASCRSAAAEARRSALSYAAGEMTLGVVGLGLDHCSSREERGNDSFGRKARHLRPGRRRGSGVWL